MKFRTDDGRPRVLISGAASGAGLACAQAFAEQGAELILADWDGIALSRTATQLGAFSCFCDAGAERSVDIFLEEISSRFGSIDVLINAAGRGYVRALTMMRMSRAALPLMRRGAGYRLIANVAPAGGFSAGETIFPYAGSFASFARLSEVVDRPMPRHGDRGGVHHPAHRPCKGGKLALVGPSLPARPRRRAGSGRAYRRDVCRRATAVDARVPAK